VLDIAVVSLVVAVMWDHPGDAFVQFYAIQMLGNVAYVLHYACPSAQTAIVDAGVVPLIMTALRKHPGDPEMQQCGYQTLAPAGHARG
jgi:hypothetical protein